MPSGPVERQDALMGCVEKVLDEGTKEGRIVLAEALIRDGEMVAYRVGRGGHRRIRRTDLDGPMHREDHSGSVELAGAEDPVLSELWDNEQDAAYDRL